MPWAERGDGHGRGQPARQLHQPRHDRPAAARAVTRPAADRGRGRGSGLRAVSRRRCWPRHGRAATRSSTVWACCCIRPCPDSAIGAVWYRRSTPTCAAHAGQVIAMPNEPAADLDGIRLLAPLTPAERAASRHGAPGAGSPRRTCAQPRFRLPEVLFIVAGRVRVVNYSRLGARGRLRHDRGRQSGRRARGAGRRAPLGFGGSAGRLPDRGLAERPVPRAAAGPQRAGGDAAEKSRTHHPADGRTDRRTQRAWAPCSASTGSCCVWPSRCPTARRTVAPLPTQEEPRRLVRHDARDGGACLGQLTKTGVARRRGRELTIPDPERLEDVERARRAETGEASERARHLEQPGRPVRVAPARRASASASG